MRVHHVEEPVVEKIRIDGNSHQPALTKLVDFGREIDFGHRLQPVMVDDSDTTMPLGDEDASIGRKRDAPRNNQLGCHNFWILSEGPASEER